MMVDTIDHFIAVSLQISSDAVNNCKDRNESSILMTNKFFMGKNDNGIYSYINSSAR